MTRLLTMQSVDLCVSVCVCVFVCLVGKESIYSSCDGRYRVFEEIGLGFEESDGIGQR